MGSQARSPRHCRGTSILNRTCCFKREGPRPGLRERLWALKATSRQRYLTIILVRDRGLDVVLGSQKRSPWRGRRHSNANELDPANCLTLGRTPGNAREAQKQPPNHDILPELCSDIVVGSGVGAPRSVTRGAAPQGADIKQASSRAPGPNQTNCPPAAGPRGTHLGALSHIQTTISNQIPSLGSQRPSPWPGRGPGNLNHLGVLNLNTRTSGNAFGSQKPLPHHDI